MRPLEREALAAVQALIDACGQSSEAISDEDKRAAAVGRAVMAVELGESVLAWARTTVGVPRGRTNETAAS